MPKPKPDKRLTFNAPEGLDIGAKEDGDTIEAVAEFSVEPGGKLCLKTINGIEVEGYDMKRGPEPAGDDIGTAVMAGAKKRMAV